MLALLYAICTPAAAEAVVVVVAAVITPAASVAVSVFAPVLFGVYADVALPLAGTLTEVGLKVPFVAVRLTVVAALVPEAVTVTVIGEPTVLVLGALIANAATAAPTLSFVLPLKL